MIVFLSVVAVVHPPFNVNDQITFKLMKRARGSLFAYPADQSIQNQDTLFNVSEIGASDVYSKLLVANAQEIIAIIAREHDELTVELQEDENGPERCFIEQAIALLKEREGFVVGQTGKKREEKVRGSEDNLNLKKSACYDLGLEKLDLHEICPDAAGGKLDEEGASAIFKQTEVCQVNTPTKHFYFYQG